MADLEVKEYVCRILSRDPDKPLDERELIEFGVEDSEAFAQAVGALAGLLAMPGQTPERVAQAMQAHKMPQKVPARWQWSMFHWSVRTLGSTSTTLLQMAHPPPCAASVSSNSSWVIPYMHLIQ